MDCHRQSVVLDPYTTERKQFLREHGIPLRSLPADTGFTFPRFGSVVPDHAADARSSKLVAEICAGSSGNHDARIDTRQAAQKPARPGPHPRSIRIADDGSQRSIEVKGSQYL
jgi:hypothetical protein